jgi:Tfp pilus assembly protein PilX
MHPRIRTSSSRIQPKTHPRGLVLIVVMVCLAVFTTLAGVLLKLSLSERRQVRMQEWRLQAEWLAESGVERAAARLADSADYAGETWKVSPEQLGAGAACVVTIEVERIDAQPTMRRVRVRADYSRDDVRAARHSKEVLVAIKQPSSETGS